jgi:hypothetical protein
MTNLQLQSIEKHIAEYLCQTGVREEIRHWIENNAVLDENGEEMELDLNSFDWNLSLELSYN